MRFTREPVSFDPRSDEWPTLQQGALVERGDTTVGAPPPPPPSPYGPPPPDNRLGAGMLLALGAIVLVAAGAVAAWFLTHRHNQPARTVVVTTAARSVGATSKIPVPRLVGMHTAQAVQRLRQLGLKVTVIRRGHAGPNALVTSQVPGTGVRTSRTTPVTIVVAGGTNTLRLPDVTQELVGRAQGALRRLGLKVTTTPVTTTSAPPGIVVQQVPKAGQKVAKSSLVTLSVAKAPARATTTTSTATATTATTTASTTAPTTTAQAPTHPASATVPDVGGQQESAAVDALAKAGILPSLVFVPSSDPLGTVEQQAKPSGTTVPYHAHVQINISEGPNTTSTERVPNVVGKTLDQALSTLNGAHLRLIFVKLAVPRQSAGKIAQQSPLAGANAPENGQVLVFLGVYTRS